MKIAKVTLITVLLLPAALLADPPAKEIPEKLQQAVLKDYPDRDLNGDGKFSFEEFKNGKRLPPRYRNRIEEALRPPPPPDPFKSLSQAQQDARMEWFREARFGMFIHWGVYAELAGYYQGKPLPQGWKYAEHIMRKLSIPVDEYEAVAATFHPVDFDADEWVKLAKDAGMKYITITAKHHDGFSMYDSDYTEYDIVDFTPFKRDPLQELAAACKKHGIRFCIYYSHMDWYFTDDDPTYNEFRINQVTELAEKYDPGVLWFDDYGFKGNFELLKHLRDRFPDLLLPDRVTNRSWGHGDFRTPEQSIPRGAQDVDWESCITLNKSWGYHKGDHDWKSTEDLIYKLIDITSKGGNFLLNIGPDGKGVILPETVERLQAVGKWMKVNSEAIYGTTNTELTNSSAVKFTAKDGKLYAFILEWPSNGHIELPTSGIAIKQAYLLADGKELAVESSANGLRVQLPAKAPDPVASVLVLE
ncbi:MAG: alpha-L-fucosidase [Verrucomicrobiota bacterium]